MRTLSTLILLLLFIAAVPAFANNELEAAVTAAREALARAKRVAQAATSTMSAAEHGGGSVGAWEDCVQMYEDSESRVERLATRLRTYEVADAAAWLSAAAACHATCIDGLLMRNETAAATAGLEKFGAKVRNALVVVNTIEKSCQNVGDGGAKSKTLDANSQSWGILASWDASKDKADIVVAQDGSGNYGTINEAVEAAGHQQTNGGRRTIIYVKTGVYYENVRIDRFKIGIMLVGDGTDKTIISGSRSVPGGFTTYQSSTLIVAGDGFWARDVTFENTAGPENHQAVAITVASDHAVFYRCSFKGYQDTLFAHSLRQFYRDCTIYGTIDFIFGDAAVVLQNCNISVRRPMDHQANMITAQGRDDPNENTGISIHLSRVRPADDFANVKGSFKTYLGRPWKRYSRVVFLKTDLDGLVNPEGWARWNGDYALDTLYYGEYMNTGDGSQTGQRVSWSGFHVIEDEGEAAKFSAGSFIQGDSWIPESGVPFQSGL